ncbi:capsular biosynthesis protein [Blautia sp. An249]|nr:capsular biosynthesis protein [Blautia sp. An249]
MTGLTDVHCHLLPHVDDGSKSLEETMEMLKLEYENGVRTIIATPHYRRGMFETPQEEIIRQFHRVKECMHRQNLQMELYLGCELHICTEMVSLLKEKKVSSMADSRYVLTEFPYYIHQESMQKSLYELIRFGYAPILAHVERYECVQKDLDFLEDLVSMGARIQVNAGSIMGESGRAAKRFCKKLMRADLLDFIGTDGHGSKYRKPLMGACAAYVEKKEGSAYARRIFWENPRKLLENK